MQIKIFKLPKQYALISSIKKSDIELVKKYRPDALKKKNEAGDDIFAMSYVEGKSCVSANGITFRAVDADTGCAVIIGALPDTLPANTTNGDYIADVVGAALPFVNEIEEKVPAIAAEIRAERSTLIGSITEA